MEPLCGSAQTSGTTLVTIPALHVWRGKVAVSIRDVGPGKGEISVQNGGTGVTPAAGTVILRAHCNGDGASLALPLTVIAGNADAILRFNTTSVEEGTGMASGILTGPGV